MGLRISPSSGIDLNSPPFLAAQKDCRSQSGILGAALNVGFIRQPARGSAPGATWGRILSAAR